MAQSLTFDQLPSEILSLRNEVLELKNLVLSLTAPQQPAQYLTRQNLANMLSVDISTIHNWCKSGKLKPLGIGSRVYFLLSDIEASLIPLNN